MRYGLADGRRRTLQEIADQMQPVALTRERIRQIELHAMAKLRARRTAVSSLRDYLRA